MTGMRNGTRSDADTDTIPKDQETNWIFGGRDTEHSDSAGTGGTDGYYTEADPIGEEIGAARGHLPTDLVVRRYEVIDAYFSPDPTTLTAHILPSAGQRAKENAGGYEDAFQILLKRYPLRTARLRDLYFRVEDARSHRVELLRLDEEIRSNHNERNNTENERLNKEINRWRDDLALARTKTNAAIEEANAALVKRKQELVQEVEVTQKMLWQLREEIATELDEEQDKEKAENRESDRIRKETVAQERDQISQEIAAAKVEAANAHADLCAVRERIATENQGAIKEAEARLESAKKEAAREWEIIAAEIQAQATTVELELSEHIAVRRDALHAAHTEAAHQQGVRAERLVAAEEKRAAQAAKAGVPLVDMERLQHREAIYQHVPGSKSGKGNNPHEYLIADPNQTDEAKPVFAWARFLSRSARTLKWLTTALCLLVFGAIFGMSLGLLFTAFNFGVFSDASTMQIALPKLLVFWSIGTGIFFIMGEAIDHSVTLAVEAHGTANTEAERRQARWLIGMSTLVVLIFIGIEATIERFGIVGAYLDQQKMLTMGHPEKINQNLMVYWAIAFIAALPFVVYHVVITWHKTKTNVAKARQLSNQSAAEKASLERPETVELLHAQNLYISTKADVDRGDAESHALVQEAQRYLAEAKEEYETHPILNRRADLDKEREEFFAVHLGIATAKLAYEKLWRGVESDPEVQGISRRLAYWEDKSNSLKQHCDRLLGILAEAATETGVKILTDGGEAVSDVLEHSRETAGDVIKSAATKAGSDVLHRGGETIRNVIGTAITNLVAPVPAALLAPAIELIHSQTTPSPSGQPNPQFSSARLNAIEMRLRDLEERRDNDPEVVHYTKLVESLQGRLRRKEEATAKRITSLKKQRRAIELKPGKYLAAEIADADAQVQIAQGIFEKEFAALMRLCELPWFIRWYAQIRNSTVVNDSMVLHVDNAMEERKKLPAIVAAKNDDD